MLVQVTAASVDSRIGKRAQDCGLSSSATGGALLASGATMRRCAVRMAAAAGAAGGLARQWLTLDVPSAILADELPPARPQGGTSGGWLGRLLGS